MEKKRHTTASGEDYLEAILVLRKQKGMVRSVDVARHMGFSKPSITHAITTLQTGGFVERDEDGFIRLTHGQSPHAAAGRRRGYWGGCPASSPAPAASRSP